MCKLHTFQWLTKTNFRNFTNNKYCAILIFKSSNCILTKIYKQHKSIVLAST